MKVSSAVTLGRIAGPVAAAGGGRVAAAAGPTVRAPAEPVAPADATGAPAALGGSGRRIPIVG